MVCAKGCLHGQCIAPAFDAEVELCDLLITLFLAISYHMSVFHRYGGRRGGTTSGLDWVTGTVEMQK